MVVELLPHPGELFLPHFAVGGDHPGVGEHLLDLKGAAVDGLHMIVEIEHLAAPAQLPAHGLAQNAPVVFQYIGLDRVAVLGGLLDNRHIPDAAHGHV